MKNYDVTIPIAGHAVVTVQAEDADSAIDAALEIVSIQDLDSWDALREFNQGNICFCPTPWEAEAQLAMGEDDDEEEG